MISVLVNEDIWEGRDKTLFNFYKIDISPFKEKIYPEYRDIIFNDKNMIDPFITFIKNKYETITIDTIKNFPIRYYYDFIIIEGDD